MIWTAERQAIALRELAEWHGTKHKDRMAVKGVGVDCINLVYEVYIAAGILPRRPIAGYSVHDGMHEPSERLQRAFLHCLHCEIIPPSAPQFGDIAIFRTGRTSGHCAFYEGGHLWHALANRMVTVSDPAEWRPAIQSIARVHGEGLKQEPQTAINLYL